MSVDIGASPLLLRVATDTYSLAAEGVLGDMTKKKWEYYVLPEKYTRLPNLGRGENFPKYDWYSGIAGKCYVKMPFAQGRKFNFTGQNEM